LHATLEQGQPDAAQVRPLKQQASRRVLLVTRLGPQTITVACHPRAQRVRLSFRRERGFRLSCPPGTSDALVEAVLQQARPWVESILERHPAPLQSPLLLPDTLCLAATGESWPLHYGSGARSSVAARAIRIPGAACSEAARVALVRIVRQLAAERLGQRTVELARQHGFVFSSVSIGVARSRWGSCSASGRIRLNAALLFVPYRLVDHVVLHELAHTRHLNHSAAFWETVAAMEPDHPSSRRALAACWQHLPRWLWPRQSRSTGG
jgi:predicted metal-dependent hydrolase